MDLLITYNVLHGAQFIGHPLQLSAMISENGVDHNIISTSNQINILDTAVLAESPHNFGFFSRCGFQTKHRPEPKSQHSRISQTAETQDICIDQSLEPF